MTRIHSATAGRRARGAVLVAVGVLAMAACRDLDVENVNAPTAETLTGSPTRAVLARTAVGIQTNALSFDDMIQQWGIYGREGWNLLGNDPRETGEEISGPQDPGGRASGQWGGHYQAIRTINTYLAALQNAQGLTEEEVRASRGFANTVKAYHYYVLAIRSGPTGIPIDVDRPISAEPAPFVSFADAMAHASTLMNEAYADLQAGGAAFPFAFVPGYTGFSTPATFATFNRGLAAEILVHRATFNDCGACWQEAATAMSQSFVTTNDLPASLATGVYLGYTGAAGEAGNPVSEALTNDRYWVHPSIVTGAQNRANGQPDLRLTNKVMDAGRTKTLNDLVATHKPVMYNSATNKANPDLGADVPWLTNEELLLLRAEIRWNTGDKAGAISDLNLVRQHAGGLPSANLTAASSDEAFIDELLYNRLYSLMWTQGVRWIDARRYDRLDELPIDRPGDVVHANMLVPAGECDARGLDAPCDP